VIEKPEKPLAVFAEWQNTEDIKNQLDANSLKLSSGGGGNPSMPLLSSKTNRQNRKKPFNLRYQKYLEVNKRRQ
jgi:hypothetical protein